MEITYLDILKREAEDKRKENKYHRDTLVEDGFNMRNITAFGDEEDVLI